MCALYATRSTELYFHSVVPVTVTGGGRQITMYYDVCRSKAMYIGRQDSFDCTIRNLTCGRYQ